MNITTSLYDMLFTRIKNQIIINNVHAITKLLESFILWDHTETRIQG
jgi:hypothetical protein